MAYPTLEQYNEVFQSPQLALSDPELKVGKVATTGLGLPLALCGGFALTYTVVAGNQKYAVRCFHKQSNLLESRYSAISGRLKQISSPYFLPFEFQPQGVRVAGSAYPIVKMSWATGETLGEFLEKYHSNKASISSLNSSLRSLSGFLETQSIAHGDIQPGNVMVSAGGQKLQLIDYDGMYVEEIGGLGSNELGHRNFQHPNRSNSSWDKTLDRFSFISLYVALRVLEVYPDLWDKTQSDGDSVLFKANDFAEPALSAVFTELFNKQEFAADAKNLASICKAKFQQVPSLDDFIAKRNIPQISFVITATTTDKPPQKYISAHPVLEASQYSICLLHVGDRVELIGKVVEVKRDKTKFGKPYIFINFGHWQGQIVKITIWSEGLSALAKHPDQSWVGKWVSVTGLMEPPYTSRRYKYTHLSVTVTQNNQLRLLTDQDARFRLGAATASRGASPTGSNKELLSSITGRKTATGDGGASSRSTSSGRYQQPVSKNEAILQRMHGSTPSGARIPQQTPPRPTYGGTSSGSSRPQTQNSNCFIATAIYGVEAPETSYLRRWRDNVLLSTSYGRLFVKMYYSLSPSIAKAIGRYPRLKSIWKKCLDRFLSSIGFDSY